MSANNSSSMVPVHAQPDEIELTFDERCLFAGLDIGLNQTETPVSCTADSTSALETLRHEPRGRPTTRVAATTAQASNSRIQPIRLIEPPRRLSRGMQAMEARASAQDWRSGYLFDPTARQVWYTHDSVVVRAFGHHLHVPKDAIVRYRTWKRHLPIGRVLLK